MKISRFWADMARRKKFFHDNEDWQHIRLWIPAHPGEVKHYVDNNYLVAYSVEKRRCICWYFPTKEGYTKYIEPLLSKSMKELEILSGWAQPKERRK
ncbi:MAG: hypothetical protein Q8M92_09030 [Candidatus Subteraquimicrobiales bacterium]|nr:hypothetical protein [Candidatus Subteraquimicrobiales bacterium]